MQNKCRSIGWNSKHISDLIATVQIAMKCETIEMLLYFYGETQESRARYTKHLNLTKLKHKYRGCDSVRRCFNQ